MKGPSTRIRNILSGLTERTSPRISFRSRKLGHDNDSSIYAANNGQVTKGVKMKKSSFLACSLVLVVGQAASAKPIKTWTSDPTGTVLIISADLDVGEISVKLRANPARLSGHEMERVMQKAVYYSTSECRIKDAGRKRITPNELVGTLECKWTKF